MAAFETNPFTVLSLIAAPAVLTNACSVLALGTSNRFARANDRARQYAIELDEAGLKGDLAEIRSRQLERAERRCLHLVRALASFYLAVGCFAAASLISAVGSGLAAEDILLPSRIALVFGLLVGVVGVGSIVRGCFLLLHETKLAVANLQEESQFVRTRRKARVKAAAETEVEESSP